MLNRLFWVVAWCSTVGCAKSLLCCNDWCVGESSDLVLLDKAPNSFSLIGVGISETVVLSRREVMSTEINSKRVTGSGKVALAKFEKNPEKRLK